MTHERFMPFSDAARQRLADPALADRLHQATILSLTKRDHLAAELPQWEALRRRARRIKLHTLTHLDDYVRQFVETARRNGATVHWGGDAEAARRIVTRIARDAGVRRVTKAKTMLGEEIDINAALESAGIEPIETDFGELICQLAGVAPSHVTAPIIDWSLEQVAALLEKKGIVHPADRADHALGRSQSREAQAAELVAAARAALRERFRSADMGVSGANFAVAESGTLVLVENEANIRLSTSLPPIHVALVGSDKLIPRLADLGTFLTLLPISATGQRQSSYVSLIHRPLNRLEIVLVDNGRLGLLADEEQYDLLSCIRCGACQNACPVYRHVSGGAYGGVYAGPIGAVLQPHLGGERRYAELPFASSLCGACSDVCPVAIPLHERLLEWRRRLVESGVRPWSERAAFAAWAWLMGHPRLYRRWRPSPEWIRGLAHEAGPGEAWIRTRDLPVPADETFAQWWKRTRG